ncbi:MAG: hypothetical protein H6626_03590 [Pseudobdellovibrionaceae bacterium]|nr:MAG: hypothetical protein H6626_03590 [Pseudobdellovibrionaceae bacterium]
MKGLVNIPTPSDLEVAYSELQNSGGPLAAVRLVTLAEWTRFDPRLGELLISHVGDHWHDIDPMKLNQLIVGSTWPAVWGVLLSQTLLRNRINQSQKTFDKNRFAHWQKLVLAGVAPTNGRPQFFIGLLRPGSPLMAKYATRSTRAFENWGFIGQEVMINKFAAHPQTVLDRKHRMRALSELLKNGSHITVDDYIHALDYKVSRRQAQRDIQSFPGIKSKGHTRNRVFWTPVPSGYQ